MAFQVGYSQNEAQLMLALCDCSYQSPNAMPGEKLTDHEGRMRGNINQALIGHGQPDWHVAWGPALSADNANMLYVAANSTTNQMAVVIRGTVPTFVLDWAQNLGVIQLQPFTSVVPQHATGQPRIAAGTQFGLAQIRSLQGATADGNQTDLTTFLRQVSTSNDVFFTGHSLGGCLASVLAPTLVFELGSNATFKIYTFAAPSPGNADFARYYNALFTDSATGKSTAYRLYNTLDVVPNAWASLDIIDSYYQPSPLCTDEIKAIVLAARTVLGAQYVQLGTDADGSARALKGTVAPLAALGLNIAGDEMFVQQLLLQHGTGVYQNLMQLPVTSALTARLRATAGARQVR